MTSSYLRYNFNGRYFLCSRAGVYKQLLPMKGRVLLWGSWPNGNWYEEIIILNFLLRNRKPSNGWCLLLRSAFGGGIIWRPEPPVPKPALPRPSNLSATQRRRPSWAKIVGFRLRGSVWVEAVRHSREAMARLLASMIPKIATVVGVLGSTATTDRSISNLEGALS
jgi:hypothetical protein